jgi:rhodanese-related sulfurtransferase
VRRTGQREILLVDVREAHNMPSANPRALLYPLSTFDSKAVPQRDAGSSSMRCGQAFDDSGAATTAGGHRDQRNLDSGLAAWKTQGLPLVR